MKYIYNNKPVVSILKNWSEYMRFRRLVETHSIEDAVMLSKIRQKAGAKHSLVFKNKPLTQLAKETNIKYHTLRRAFLQNRIEEVLSKKGK
jgi:ABC-type nitrate/sulfonate/bicarbonate transport system ATPase subunit